MWQNTICTWADSSLEFHPSSSREDSLVLRLLSRFVQKRRRCRICRRCARHEHFGRWQEKNASHHRRLYVRNWYESNKNFHKRISSSQLQRDLHKSKFVQRRQGEQKHLSQYSLLGSVQKSERFCSNLASRSANFPRCDKVLQGIFCRCDLSSLRLLADRPSNDDSRGLVVAHRHLFRWQDGRLCPESSNLGTTC